MGESNVISDSVKQANAFYERTLDEIHRQVLGLRQSSVDWSAAHVDSGWVEYKKHAWSFHFEESSCQIKMVIGFTYEKKPYETTLVPDLDKDSVVYSDCYGSGWIYHSPKSLVQRQLKLLRMEGDTYSRK